MGLFARVIQSRWEINNRERLVVFILYDFTRQYFFFFLIINIIIIINY